MEFLPQSVTPTPLTNLLDELSFEGNAKTYHGGGRGRENVLTVEVFDALTLLPRNALLGAVMPASVGADLGRGTCFAASNGPRW